MTETSLPLNPWLTDVVQLFRKSRSDSYLRNWYKMSCDKGENLSWPEFMTRSSLEEFLHKNPFLKKSLAMLDITDKAKDILYWAGVDSLYDLLQITKEELGAICINEEQVKEEITQYLTKLGKELKSYPGKTSKLSPAYGYWTIPSPGASHNFNFARPTLREEWFDVYYKNYEYQAFEEELEGKLRYVKPEANNGEIPKAIFDFLQDTRYFFDAYKQVCQENESQIHRVVEEPDEKWFTDDFEALSKFTNEHYLAIKKDVVRAMISVLENTDLLGMPTYFFLRLKDDEKKIKIIEGLKNQNFQLMMIEYVAVRIGMDDVVAYFMELDKNAQDKKPESVKPEPVNPWLAELIKLYRKGHDDNEAIREAYKQFCETNPDKSWADYLGEEALCDAIRRSPYLATRLEDMDMPERTKQILKDNCSVDTLTDIMQITREEFNVLFEDSRGDLNVLVHFLEQTFDLRLYHHDFYTYKLSVPWDRFTPQAIS